MKEAGISEYEDIIALPHHVSASHPQMALADRAAQFSPFAALTGYEDAIDESARLTEEQIELDENAREELDEKLRQIRECGEAHPEITVTYFQKDARKDGGAYVCLTGRVKKIDEYARIISFMDGTVVRIENILQCII